METCSVCKSKVVADAARGCGTCFKLVEAIKTVVADEAKSEIVRRRQNINVLEPPETFDREVFWKQMVGCLCSSNQRVGPGRPVSLFLLRDPFPLSLLTCEKQHAKGQGVLEFYAHQEIQRAGVNYSFQIPKRLVWNLDLLQNRHGWSEMEVQSKALARIPRNAAAAECIEIERKAAHVAMEMHGIGPKQSRNLWICLGLTRYEIPLDGRVTKWFNEKQTSFIEKKNLRRSHDYEATEDRIQSLCKEANVFPCLFDAAAFISEEKPSRNK